MFQPELPEHFFGDNVHRIIVFAKREQVKRRMVAFVSARAVQVSRVSAWKSSPQIEAKIDDPARAVFSLRAQVGLFLTVPSV
jgi:hypothetical protein